MALTDFFRINFPYGMVTNSKGEWMAFNREYMPLGWNSSEHKVTLFEDNCYGEHPVYTKYVNLTDAKILKIIDEKHIKRDDGKIKIIYFYDDVTNPKDNPKFWDRYLKIIQYFSKLENQNSIFDM